MVLDIIAAAIKARLEETAVFKAVDQGFTQRVLKSPPSAVFFLGEDNRVQDDPYTVRETTWHIALMVVILGRNVFIVQMAKMPLPSHIRKNPLRI